MSNDNEVLVKVEGVSKIFCRDLKKSLWYGACDIMSELNPFGRRSEVGGRNAARALANSEKTCAPHSGMAAGNSEIGGRRSEVGTRRER